MKVRLGPEAFVGGAGKLALSPGLNSFLSNAPQPSAPSLVLTEVSALDRTSASVPPAGQGSTAAWVSSGAPHPNGAGAGISPPTVAPCPLQPPPLSGD